jgi:hypothetical protein
MSRFVRHLRRCWKQARSHRAGLLVLGARIRESLRGTGRRLPEKVLPAGKAMAQLRATTPDAGRTLNIVALIRDDRDSR